MSARQTRARLPLFRGVGEVMASDEEDKTSVMPSDPSCPPGWQEVDHHSYAVPCYVHTATRVVAWTRPYKLDLPFGYGSGSAEMHQPPHESIGRTGFVDLQSNQMMLEWEHRQKLEAASIEHAPTIGDRSYDSANVRISVNIDRELDAPPPLTHAQFRDRCENGDTPGRQGTVQSFPQRFLLQYARTVLGATVDSEVGLATDRPSGGPFAPPSWCAVYILGIKVGYAIHSSRETCRLVACEEALLALCPKLYTDELRKFGVRPTGRPTARTRQPRLHRPAIIDEAEIDALGVDDDRVLDIDACMGKSPTTLMHEHICRTYGQTMPTTETREATRRATESGEILDEYTQHHVPDHGYFRTVRGYEHVIKIGTTVITAFDTTSKRAKQRAAVDLLRNAHPHVSKWRAMMELYPSSEGGTALPARSQTAEAILSADKLTLVSLNMKAKEQKYAERGVAVSSAVSSAIADPAGEMAGTGANDFTSGHAGGGEGSGDAVGDERGGAYGRRLLPGAGAGYTTDWQRQVDVEHAKRAAQSEGGNIGDDTLFAFKYHQRREVADESKLARLRSLFEEIGSARGPKVRKTSGSSSSSQDRWVCESAALSAGLVAELERRRLWMSDAVDDLSKVSAQWAPWKAGTRTHAKLVEIAAAGAPPLAEDAGREAGLG